MRVHDRRSLVGVYERCGELAGLVDAQLRDGRLGRTWDGARMEGQTALLRNDRCAGVRGFLGLGWLGEEFGESLGAVESFLLLLDICRTREARGNWKRGEECEARCREHLHSDMRLISC
jgi:hypothetical protein